VVPTVIIAAFVARLVLPPRWPWFVGIVVGCGVGWAVVVGLQEDVSMSIRLAAFFLGAINAFFGAAVATPARRFMARRAHASSVEEAPDPESHRN
jgi:hypothetical protein